MCSFGSCQTRFEFLSQFRKVRNAFECFVTQVQTQLPKTKRVWPMKINVICYCMCIQFRSYLRGAKFTLRMDHKSLVWLHRFKDTEGMMARWLHALQQFSFFPSSTGRVTIMVMQTASPGPHRHRVDSAPSPPVSLAS